MPIPESKLYKPDKLHKWFAISSILMTGSILWMIEVDYNRPWRGHQDDYYLSKAAMAHLDYLDASREDRVQEIKVAKQRLADAQELADRTTSVQREKLVVSLADADLEFRKADGPFSRTTQVLQVLRDTYERALGLHGHDHSATKQAHKIMTDAEEEVAALRREAEKWKDERRRVEIELRELDRPIRENRKTVEALESIASEALRKDQQYRGVLGEEHLLKRLVGELPVVKGLINAPLLDFVSPKNTPSRHQVNQLVLPDVRQRLNYLESYTTDRCTTCHVAIGDPEFSKDQLARKLERSLPGVNEALQRMGHQPFDLPVPPEVASGSLSVGKVTEHWDELTEQQQEAYFDTLLELVNSYLELSGRKTIELGQPLLAHPDLELFVTLDSAHPMAKIGCTVCHEGNSQETDFILAAHSPATHKIEEQWRDEYYIHSLGVPNMTFETMAHYWDRPMRLPHYTEAGCAKCHEQIADISRFRGEPAGTRINRGQQLFTAVGCINCHNEDSLAGSRRVGPDLANLSAKLKPGFVQQWMFFPQKFRPSTRMPHFFLQENNCADSDNQFDTDPVLRTETEVAAISQYLFAVSDEWNSLDKPDGVTGDVKRGRELFRSTGCLACHGNIAEYGEEWITDDLVHRLGIDKETAGFRYKGMTYDERVRYAMEHFPDESDSVFNPEVALFNPESDENLPTFTRFAPELSAIGSKVTEDWLYSWLIEPTHYAPDTKMPSMRLTPGEAADIAAYLVTLVYDGFEQGEFELNTARRKMADDLMFELLSAQRSERRSRAIMADEGEELTDTLVSLLSRSMGKERSEGLIRPMSLEDKKLTFLGSKMIGHYGCYACHNIRGFETTTPPGTDMSIWAEKPVTQLDFAFYDHAFHGMREEQDDVYGYIYRPEHEELAHFSPLPEDAREEITHTHAAFAKHKMLNPRIWDREKLKAPYDKLKMPNFYFTEEEAESLTTFLLSRMPARVSASVRVDYEGTTAGPIAAGRRLTRELNCVGCHEIEDNASTIHQYFRRDLGSGVEFDSINAPPSLRGEGAKLQHPWFHRFLQDVEPLRPWLQVRMPSFNLTGEQATTLVEYFAALSRDDSQKLAQSMAKVDEYIDKLGDDEADESPGSDWYEQESLELQTAHLRRFAIERKLVRSREVDMLNTRADRLRKGHERLLDRIGFIQQLYNVAYPFVEPPRPRSSNERFALGSRFLDDMGCLACHVFGEMLPGPATNTDEFVNVYRLDGVRGEGDEAVAILNGEPYAVGSVIDGHTLVGAVNINHPNGDIETKAYVEGPNTAGGTEKIMLQAASAPNLNLTYQRLRRQWVYDWMLEPQWIQPGTKMPQNFMGGKSPFEGDENYPGTGEDHINLLVDYLYDAGAANTRVPLTKIIAVEEEAFDEDDEGGEFDEDEFEDD